MPASPVKSEIKERLKNGALQKHWSASSATPPPFRSPELPERAGTFCRNVVILGGSMFFSEYACCYCQPLSATLPVTLLFLHPLAAMLKCCFCGSKGASMTGFHDLQLKEQLLLQQK